MGIYHAGHPSPESSMDVCRAAGIELNIPSTSEQDLFTSGEKVAFDFKTFPPASGRNPSPVRTPPRLRAYERLYLPVPKSQIPFQPVIEIEGFLPQNFSLAPSPLAP